MRTRHSFITGRGTAAFVATSAMGASAIAQPPLDFDYVHLDSTYVSGASGSGTLTVSAVDLPAAPLVTEGFVRRNDPPAGTAGFLPGFVSTPDPEDFQMSLLITQITSTSAQANGTMTITDIDGDTLSATIAGTFNVILGGHLLTASVTNVFLVSDEGFFDGDDGGQFDTAFLPGVLSSGAMQLSFVLRGTPIFDEDFQDVDTTVVGWIPAPSGAAALAFAGLAAARRRRS